MSHFWYEMLKINRHSKLNGVYFYNSDFIHNRCSIWLFFRTYPAKIPPPRLWSQHLPQDLTWLWFDRWSLGSTSKLYGICEIDVSSTRVDVYIYTYVYIYMYIYICIYIYMYNMYIYIYIYVYQCISIYIYIYMYNMYIS